MGILSNNVRKPIAAPARKVMTAPAPARSVSLPGAKIRGVQSRHTVAAPVRGISALGVKAGPGQVSTNAHSGSPGVLPWRPNVDPNVKRQGLHERPAPWTKTAQTPSYARGASSSFLSEQIVITQPPSGTGNPGGFGGGNFGGGVPGRGGTGGGGFHGGTNPN